MTNEPIWKVCTQHEDVTAQSRWHFIWKSIWFSRFFNLQLSANSTFSVALIEAYINFKVNPEKCERRNRNLCQPRPMLECVWLEWRRHLSYLWWFNLRTLECMVNYSRPCWLLWDNRNDITVVRWLVARRGRLSRHVAYCELVAPFCVGLAARSI